MLTKKLPQTVFNILYTYNNRKNCLGAYFEGANAFTQRISASVSGTSVSDTSSVPLFHCGNSLQWPFESKGENKSLIRSFIEVTVKSCFILGRATPDKLLQEWHPKETARLIRDIIIAGKDENSKVSNILKN